MSAADWANIISCVLAVLASAGVTIRWVIKRYLVELRPNHGSSLHDKISLEILPLIKELRQHQKEVEEKVHNIDIKVAKLEGRLEQHTEEGQN